MRVYHPGREAERDSYGSVLMWLLVLTLGILLILCRVKCYDLTRQNQQLAQEWQNLQEELREKQRQQEQHNLTALAEELGMYRPQPEEYHIINVE